MRILLRLFRSLAPYRLRVAILFVCILAVTGASLTIPALIRAAIDDGLSRNSPAALLSVGLAIVGTGLVRALFNFGRRYLSETLVNRLGYDFRNQMYDQIQRLSFSYHDQVQTGQLMSRCTEDITALSRFVGQGGVDLLNVTLLLTGILVLLFSTSATLMWIGLAPLVVLVLVTYLLQRRQRRLYLRTDRALGQVSAVLQENLGGAQVVRALAREEYEKAKFESANRQLYDDSINVVSSWGFFWATMGLLVMLSTTLVLWFGGQMVIAGTLTLGELVAFNAYLVLLAGPVSDLGFIVNAAGEAAAGGQRIYEILDLPREIQSPPQPVALPVLTGRVTFETVSFAYRRGEGAETYGEALQGISFAAEPNQVIALIGPTGSGKTTLVNLIPRFYDVTGGAICVDGHDVRTVDLRALRAQIGIVLQTSLLFSMTIRENIAYGRVDATDAEVERAARAARADEFIGALPEGYATVVGERGVTLSGGQRQRIAIARALLLDPRILILDDSTSSVDMQTEYLIQQALAELMRGRTTFIIAQRLATVQRADQILVLDRGRIVQHGRHAELLAQEGGLYQEIYNLQLKDQDQFRREMLFL